MTALVVYTLMLLFVFAVLEWAPRIKLTWLEGWLIPHTEPRDNCRVKCGTCVGATNAQES